MKETTEAKAVRLVLEGKVDIEFATLDADGLVEEALGFVKGDSRKTWMVHLNGDETSCDCPYGKARESAHGHSHDLAVRLAAQGFRPAKETSE